ncbi:MAG: molecular chaperone DnaK [Clostridia bacterium]|nr:molecular chaperone DnaK [Clostridia bacterium]
MSNKRTCGIDLGTSTLCVAITENGKSKVIENNEGRRTTPSMVYLKGDERKIGDSAKRSAIMNPKNTVSLIKRFMGVEFSDPDAQKTMKTVAYDVVNDNGRPRVKIDGKTYTPEQISAMYLEHMVKIAHDYYNEDVKDVVITCPAWYNDVQRNAVKTAGELAGLNVLRVINEPTAAILSSDIDVKNGSKIVMVNDLGGGTEDVSICEVSDGVIEVLASYGDVFLGGSNYDQAVINWIVDEFKKDKGVDLTKDPLAYPRVVEAAEKAKIELSSTTSTEINLPYITSVDGVPQMLLMTLTRAKFEALTADLTQKVVDCARQALAKAGKTYDQLDEVLLIGGSSRIPAVQEALAKEFNKPLNKTANFDEAVALGAARQANVIVGGEGSEDATLLLDVTPISLGIETMGEVMTTLIPANTTIPTSKTQVFTTAVDNQPAVSIVVLQGERPMSKDNKRIGNFDLDGIAPAPRGIPQIEVTFDIDANGILSVSAKDLATQKEQHITINNQNSLTKEEIEKIKADAEKFKAEDEKKMQEINELNQMETFAFSVKNTLDNEQFKDKITEDQRNEIKPLLDELEEKLKTRNLDEIRPAKENLEKVFQPIITKIYQEAAANAQPQADGATAQAASDLFGNANPFNTEGNPFDGTTKE